MRAEQEARGLWSSRAPLAPPWACGTPRQLGGRGAAIHIEVACKVIGAAPQGLKHRPSFPAVEIAHGRPVPQTPTYPNPKDVPSWP